MELTYELVDDLSFAAQRGHAKLEGHIAATTPAFLGPLVEYVWLRRRLAMPSLSAARPTPLGESFRAFASAGAVTSPGSLNDGSPHGFARIPTSEEGFTEAAWVTFKSRLMFAAEAHGFSRSQAAGLVGAFGEMASNAFEHSQHPQSAIAGFRSDRHVFELVVADAGVGAAASLRRCPDFSHIHDTGEALKLCVSDGVSRHGRAAGRGFGFQILFARLADFNARVRIRSDDQVIDLYGERLGPRLAVPAGRAAMRGMVVSTQCFPPA